MLQLASASRRTAPPSSARTRAHASSEGPGSGSGSDSGAEAEARQRLVLIAEDYEDTRALYAEHLSEAGFRVIEAADGEQAVALALALRPEAIVMDLSMPKVDGWDATRRIRALPEMADTYIVVLSALDGEYSRAMAFDAGCNDFIRKPMLGAALAEVLVGHFKAEEP